MAREVRIGNGRAIRENSEGQLHVLKERHNAWPAKSRAAFLDHLAATCNVTEAARSVGVFPATPHRVRRRDPGFAAQWSQALEAGYVTLETMLLTLVSPVGNAAVVMARFAIGAQVVGRAGRRIAAMVRRAGIGH